VVLRNRVNNTNKPGARLCHFALLGIAGIGINAIAPNQNACRTGVSFQETALVAGLAGLSVNIFLLL